MDKARYSLTVLKVPLNPNQSIIKMDVIGYLVVVMCAIDCREVTTTVIDSGRPLSRGTCSLSACSAVRRRSHVIDYHAASLIAMQPTHREARDSPASDSPSSP